MLQGWVKDAPSADKLLGKSEDAPIFQSAQGLRDFMRSREKK